MTTLSVRAPSRLHFGLLSWGPESPRQFGGVGLMVEEPGLEISAAPAKSWGADGPLAERALQFAGRVAGRMAEEGTEPPPLHFRIHRAPPEHAGLGTGTQLGLAVARILAATIGRPETPATALAALAGRGLRSGIGLHGSERGGLIVDGGRRGPEGVPPLLARLGFPEDWDILLVIPGLGPGLHGPSEVRAFAELPATPASLTDRLCRIALLGLLPAVVERDLAAFGEALDEFQHLVGRAFAPAQGGLYASPELEAIVEHLRAEGLQGVGQSSWGPTLYGFQPRDEARRGAIASRLLERFAPGSCRAIWTRAAGPSVLTHPGWDP